MQRAPINPLRNATVKVFGCMLSLPKASSNSRPVTTFTIPTDQASFRRSRNWQKIDRTPEFRHRTQTKSRVSNAETTDQTKPGEKQIVFRRQSPVGMTSAVKPPPSVIYGTAQSDMFFNSANVVAATVRSHGPGRFSARSPRRRFRRHHPRRPTHGLRQ